MDTQTLLNSLGRAFETERGNGLIVDCFGLAPAYQGMVENSYILGVSAPSLTSSFNCNDKADTIIDILFTRLTPEQRKPIDRVRVYDSVEEYERHARCNFDDSYYGYCEAPLRLTQTRAIA